MDAYANNLASVNEVQDVVATDDIFNAQGQILVKKGSRINPQMVDKITRFKLLKPLESSVVIENELTAGILLECFSVYLNNNPCTASINERFADQAELKSFCHHFCQFALLRQKLTVLSLVMPAIFEQAIFCAWLGTILTRQLPNLIDRRDFFLAALCHDIGMVHIDGQVLNKEGSLTLEEWKQIQSHPIIGYNIVKEIAGINGSVAKAILEHHENLDGTGYPRGRMGSSLGNEGQLLNLLDSVNAIFNKHFKPFNRSMRELLPIMQMNQHSRFGMVARHLIMLLKELPQGTQHSIPSELADEVITAVKERNAYIAKCVDVSAEIASAIGLRHDDPTLASLQNAIIHITMSITQSGIINGAYIRWLDQVQSEKLNHAYKEVEEAYLMMQEIIYHIDKLKRQLQLCLEKAVPDNLTTALATGLTRLDRIALPSINPQLEKLWLFNL
ncbi:MAG: HD domain-containing protein [Cellvibrionaceae bacterium]|nr:HD domain-containing protein [Cellvibrionaceae bacterium]